LRDAITNANANPGHDLIDFPNGTVYNIVLLSQLPPLTDNAGVTIDGYTGPNCNPNTIAQGQPSDAVLKVILTTNVPWYISQWGIHVMSNNNTIRGLVINNFYTGIFIDGNYLDSAGNNDITGCYIGTNRFGTASVPNNIGVFVSNGAGTSGSPNLIGDNTNGGRNLISGNNTVGIWIDGTGTEFNQVLGNYIGTNVNGNVALGNIWSGVQITGGASFNCIGSILSIPGPFQRNVIAGNGFYTPSPVNYYNGVDILNQGTMNNVIGYNFIGTDCTGNFAIPNGQYGVRIHNLASNNTITGVFGMLTTVISGNLMGGVWIDAANANTIEMAYIGLDATGSVALPNQGPGVYLTDGAQQNNIGNIGMAPLFISGNYGDGIRIEDPGTNSNLVRCVFVGLDANGSPRGNGGNGIHILNGPQFTQIGGNYMETNTIAHNTLNGILINNAQYTNVFNTSFNFNQITNNGGDGIAVLNANSISNTFSRNIIKSNNGLGIDLNNDGVTANDAGDPDMGPNDLLNFPVITSATVITGGFIISGTLNISSNPQLAIVEVYLATLPDPSGYGEAIYPIGSTSPGPSGSWFITSTATLNPGDFVTALTIDQFGNTSELSQNFIVSGPMTFSVTNNADSGPGSLRDAITNANANPGHDIIDFPNASVYNIVLLTQLPPLTDNAGVTIDGYTGPNCNPNTNPQGQPSNAVLKVVITTSVPFSLWGIYIFSINNTIRGLVINNFFAGITIDGALLGGANNSITGCYIGSDRFGTAVVPNNIGVYLYNGAGGFGSNFIGDGTNGGRNLISGNSAYGIWIDGNGTYYNYVQGNYIGTNVNGNLALGNLWSGVRISGSASYNYIGAINQNPGQNQRNIISGNGFASPNPANNFDGVDIEGSWTMNNVVGYNFIGTDCTGNIAIPNALYGVSIFNAASWNTISGPDITTNLYAVISGNTTGGVWIDASNFNTIEMAYIGLDAAGILALPNQGPGVHLTLSSQLNHIGSSGPACLYISGNAGDGILIQDLSTNTNWVSEVTIGLDKNGSPRGNGGNGIHILNGPQSTIIGANQLQFNTTIAYNVLSGILIDNAQLTDVINPSSFIINQITNNGGNGITVLNQNSTGNRFSGNIINNNNGLGIDLNNDGVTGNDAGDPDTGPNGLLNFPVITFATAITGGGLISGTLDISSNPQQATVEVYLATPPDPGGYGEAVVPLGLTIPGPTGAWFLTSTVPLNPGDFLTALAIDQFGNTSELSQNFIVPSTLHCDFGDALDPPYPTLIGSNGAGHAIVSGGPWLGNSLDFPDPEPDGQPFTYPSGCGQGDDLTGSDDENGVFFSPLYSGSNASITIEVQNGPAWVDAWLDFNGNGIWGDIGTEYLFWGFFNSGVNSIVFVVPAGAVNQTISARFRINSIGPLLPTGIASDGEVEDYEIPISVLWLGGTPGAENDWLNPNNWSNGIVPSVFDDLVIPGGLTYPPVITGTVTCDDILIQDGGVLTLNSGANFTANGNMTIGQGVSGSVIVNGGTGLVVGTTIVNPGGLLQINGGNFTP